MSDYDLADRNDRQRFVFEWGVLAFGGSQMTSSEQRAIRLLEEAVELAQAARVDRKMAHNLVDFVYDRDVGDLRKKLGGVSVCLLALAQCLGVDADTVEKEEVRRILARPIEEFARRNKAKNDAGFKSADVR